MMKANLLKKVVAIFLCVLLVVVMMPVGFVQAVDANFEVTLNTGSMGTVTYSVVQGDTPIAKDQGATNTFTIDNAKDIVIEITASATGKNQVKKLDVGDWKYQSDTGKFKQTILADTLSADTNKITISVDEFFEEVPVSPSEKNGTVTVDVSEGGCVKYSDDNSETKEINKNSLEEEKSVSVKVSKEFTIVPNTGYYIASVKLDESDIEFKKENLDSTSYKYTYNVESASETKTLNVVFGACSQIEPQQNATKDITQYGVNDINEDGNVYINSSSNLTMTSSLNFAYETPDGVSNFAKEHTINAQVNDADKTTEITKVYELNSNPKSFADVVLAYNMNVKIVGDTKVPTFSTDAEGNEVWENNSVCWVNTNTVELVGYLKDDHSTNAVEWSTSSDYSNPQTVNVDSNNHNQFKITIENVDAEQLPTVYIRSTDKAGNSASVQKQIKIDKTEPEVSFEFSNGKSLINIINTIITGKKLIDVTITVTDEAEGSGVKGDATVVSINNEKQTEVSKKQINNNQYQYVISNVDASVKNGKVTVRAEDIAGNINADASSPEIVYDKTKPTVKNKILNGENKEDYSYKTYYYKDDVTSIAFDMEFKDDIGIKSYVVTVNGSEKTQNKNYAEQSSLKVEDESTFSLDTVQETTEYTVVSTIEDFADHTASATTTVKQDKYAPAVSLNALKSKNADAIIDIAEKDVYYTNKTNMDIMVNVTDAGVGVKTINLYDGDTKIATYVVGGSNSKSSYADGIVTFKSVNIDKKSQHRFTVEAIDKLDNGEGTKIPLLSGHNNTIQYDKDAPTVSFTINSDTIDANGNPLFKSAATAGVKVSDLQSGVASSFYSIHRAGYDASGNDTDKPLSLSSGAANITVDGNSNGMVLSIKTVDKVGNEITAQNVKGVSIDKTAPTIDIAYDNNNVDSGNRYKANRTATITVTERNFKANDFKLKITNSAGKVPSISNWTTIEDGENPDNNKHIATVSFTSDGDYTMDLSYTDMAGNKAGSVATQSFTIDKSAPLISVSFDNNNATNDTFFAAGRTATITVNEHYFDASRVVVEGTATHDGSEIAFPGISGWTSTGDVHTATIHFTADGNYAFTVRATDQSGNISPDSSVPEFVIDQTIPTITFGGVEDQASYNDTVEPTVTFEDVNYDSNNVNITLVGANHGEVNFANGAGDSRNGQTFSFTDFEHDEEVDDIYTLTATITDKAGNQFEDNITFSVNRFGSNYVFDDSLEEIKGKYIKAPIDVIFTETNVNTLTDGTSSVVVSTNGSPRTLERGQDYSVENSGGGGNWSQYEYTINKDVFKADGTYIVSVYSEDTAGNINENDAEGKDAEITFGVDATNPAIVMSNLEENGNYNDTSYQAIVNVSDNLILEDVKVTVNGAEVKTKKDNDNYTFALVESNDPQVVAVSATDAAGNSLTEEVEGIIVSTNVFVRALNNKVAVIGTVAAVGVAAGLGGYVAVHGGIGALHFRPKKKFTGKK